MAHLLQARQSGVVAEVNIKFEKGAYQFQVDLQKWDDKSNSVVKSGNRNFPLPSNLWQNYTVGHFKTQLAAAIPRTLPGGEHRGEPIQDDTKISTIAPVTPESPQSMFLIFNIDKNAAAAQDAPTLSRAQSMGPVKAGTGAITPDRELATEVSVYSDSGTNYITVTAKNDHQSINWEGKWTVSENNLSSTTVKEFKSKLAGFPKTSDRGTFGGSKTIKDLDKMGALGVKGKKGDTLKFAFTFELAPLGGAAGSSAAPAPVSTSFEPAPEIDANVRFLVVLQVSMMEGSVFLSMRGNTDPSRAGGPLPEAHKTAALPKVTFSVFKVSEFVALLKGALWPVLQKGMTIYENSAGQKQKVPESVTLDKLGITFSYNATNEYKFIFAIDPSQPLPSQ